MKTKDLVLNAVIAALYATIALVLPATALANYRLSTALYVVAGWNPSLIPGLALGNALAGLPQGPIDVLMGTVVGLATAYACSKMKRWGWVAVAVIPTLLVPLWLTWLFDAPYLIVVLTVAKGQAVSALLAYAFLKVKRLESIVKP